MSLEKLQFFIPAAILPQPKHLLNVVMSVLRIAVSWFIFLQAHSSMRLSTKNAQLKKLFSTGAISSFPAEVTVEQGREVFAYAKLRLGTAELEAAVKAGKVRLPRGFWPSFFQTQVRRTPNKALYKMFRKAFLMYIRSLSKVAEDIFGNLDNVGAWPKVAVCFILFSGCIFLCFLSDPLDPDRGLGTLPAPALAD